ncbi:MAG: NB-ARC domain-containing protein [Rhodobacteraceae bacterium]|nr:NB-ARC domain-containing protein [Paracoccaceae bacterium]
MRAIFEGIDQRIQLDKEDSDSAYFHALMLKLEYLTKLVTAGVIACVADDTDRNRYSQEHTLVRANSIGDWVGVLNNVLGGPAAQFFLPGSQDVVKDLNERVGLDDWRHSAVTKLAAAAGKVGSEIQLGTRLALRRFFEIGVQIRNQTRGHGATTIIQQSQACRSLEIALAALEENLQLFNLPWVYLHKNLSGKYRVSPLSGETSCFDYLKRTNTEQLRDGVYVYLDDTPVRVSLVFSDPNLHDIALPNGDHKNGTFELLSYISNDRSREDVSNWSLPVGQLPPSDTEGDDVLEPFGQTHANVPPVLDDYVSRQDLVGAVVRELLQTDRHPVISLTGPGGIGKTTITIAALHAIAKQSDLPYEVILWISARDIDLLESGPKAVRPRVINQHDISRAAVDLLQPQRKNSSDFNATAYFEGCLRDGAAGNTIFVLDNFETVQNPADVYAWLDTHVRLPNKVLITTRIREFSADFPITIGGMTDEQAALLIDRHSDRLDIRGLITSKYKRQLISESDGHPYVMRIMLGRVAEQGRAETPERIMATSDHILRALFERTFGALSPGARRVFLLLSSWKVFVPEIAIEAVLLRPGNDKFNVAEALDQLHRFSLVERLDAEEKDHVLVGVPLAASIFGGIKLGASEFRVSVEEDRKLLMEFGPGRGKNTKQKILPRIENLYKSIASQAQTKPQLFEKYRPVMEFLAEKMPTAFLSLADLAQEAYDSTEAKDLAKQYLRRYLEVSPTSKKEEVWCKLAALCRASKDATEEIHALCEAALLSSSNAEKLENYANHLNNRIKELKSDSIEEAWSSEVRDILQKVIKEMDRCLSDLTATGCSRLAWLHLNVGNDERARDIARHGIDSEPDNVYCQKLVKRLDA